MENQHRAIVGFRDFDRTTVDKINAIKQHAEDVGDLIEALRADPEVDLRWLSIGQTDLQKGFMATVRSVAKPDSF